MVKKLFLILASSVFIYTNAFGALSAGDTSVGNAGSGNLSHDVSGSDTILIVAYVHEYIGITYISSVTYNGDALTRLQGQTSYTTTYELGIWYLVNPDAGTHDIQLSSTSNSINIVGVTYSGAEQATPDDSDRTYSESVTTLDSSVETAIADSLVLIFGGSSISSGTWSNVSGQTLVLQANAPGGNSHDMAFYTLSAPTATTYTATVTTNSSANLWNGSVAIAPAEAGGTRNRMIMIY